MNSHADVSTRNFNPHGNRTIDGIPITKGLRVWDYDLRAGTVVADEHDGDHGFEDQHWYRVCRDLNEDGTGGGYSIMDGTRMWVAHPTTGDRAPEGPAIPEYGIGKCSDCGISAVLHTLTEYGVKWHLCWSCFDAARPHLFPSGTSIMAYCGTVQRLGTERTEAPDNVDPRTSTNPDLCPWCINEVVKRNNL
jgi:hypothetical protein